MPFVHLSVRSHYSLLRGTARVEELCRAARARGMSALALTDRNALYGFYPFLCAAVRAGVRPLVGAELAIGVERVVALVKERFGYATLCRAITAVQAHLPRPERATARAHGPERDPASQRDRVRDAVAATPRGSAAAFVGAEPDAPPDGPECAPGEYWMRGGGRERSRGRGPALDLPMPVAAGPFSLAAHLARDRAGLVLLTDDLPLLETIARQSGIEDLYREVRASLCGPDASRAGGDRRAVPDSVLLAALPVVATNDVYFLDPADHALHRLLRAIALNTSLSRVPALEVVHPGAWLCPPADMERRFRDLPEAFENAGRIADGCRVDWLAETGIRPAAPAPTPSHPPAAPSIVHGKTPTLRLPVAARPLPPPGSNRQSVASHHPPSPVVSHPHALPPRPASPFGINLQSSISNLQSVGLPPSSPPVSPPPPRSSALPVSPPAPAPLLGRPIFPVFAAPGGGDPFDYLRAETWTGARRRYREITPAVRARIEYELALIREKGFASYFLVVRDIVRRSERTCGRGSAAASIVAYVLGITHVDPIAHNLYFERFLNPGRVDPPDIDVDFPWDERDAVLEYLFRTYGPAHTAMIANHVTFQPRAAIREVAKVYGLPEGEIADLTERIPWFYDAPGLRDMLRDHPHFRDVALRPPWPEILALAERLVGFPRLLSVHCGGVVITPDPITNHAPLEPAAKGLPIVQWEKDAAEELGLVKIDLLGNRSLAVIRDALAAVRAHHGVDVRYDEWDPLEDPATQALLAAGRTMGVFYVESPAMRRLQQKTGRGDFGHLVIASSIIRPAANAFIREYVRRLRGEPYASLHPILDTVLAETYGIMSYQEDVSKIAMAMGGFTAAEADGLRKLLSKKDRVHKLAEYRRRFADGARIRGIAADVIDKVWEMIESFAGYSFCKPHSASYALVSFKSAWLKAHFPAEFMAAVISNQGGYYSTFAYLSEARRMGIALLGPDVNASGRAYIGWTPAPGVTAVAPTPAGGAPLPPPSSGGAVPPFAHFVPDVPPPPPDLSPAANSAQGEWGRSLPHEAPRGARSGVGAGEGACYDRSGYHADPSAPPLYAPPPVHVVPPSPPGVPPPPPHLSPEARSAKGERGRDGERVGAHDDWRGLHAAPSPASPCAPSPALAVLPAQSRIQDVDLPLPPPSPSPSGVPPPPPQRGRVGERVGTHDDWRGLPAAPPPASPCAPSPVLAVLPAQSRIQDVDLPLSPPSPSPPGVPPPPPQRGRVGERAGTHHDRPGLHADPSPAPPYAPGRACALPAPSAAAARAVPVRGVYVGGAPTGPPPPAPPGLPPGTAWLRVGLMQIAGLKEEAIRALLTERERRGPFRSLADALERVDLDPADARLLIRAGAFDALPVDHRVVAVSATSASAFAPEPDSARGSAIGPVLDPAHGTALRPASAGARAPSGASGLFGSAPAWENGPSRRRTREPTSEPANDRMPASSTASALASASASASAAVTPVAAATATLRATPHAPTAGVAPRALAAAPSGPPWSGAGRPRRLWWLAAWSERRARRRDRTASLFPEPPPAPLPAARPYDAEQLLFQEVETLGLLVSRHPLALYRAELARIRHVPGRDLARHVGRTVTVVGWWVTGKIVETKQGEPMEFVSFEDTTAIYEATFFPQAYARFCRMLNRTRPYVLRGQVEEDQGTVALVVEQVSLLGARPDGAVTAQ